MKVVFVILVAFAIQGCDSQVNLLQGVDLESGQTLALDTPIKFVLRGTGICNSVNIDWGDGRTDTHTYPFSYPVGIHLSGTSASDIATRTVSHTFSGWGGGKTVTAAGTGCEGKVKARFNFPPLSRSMGWALPAPRGTNGVCQTMASLPAMIPRMLVHISLPTVASARDINFGCPFESCVYDADGKPGSVAGSSFPFQGLKEYSVVLRLGSQVVQGGTNTQFTTTASGPLEFCLNDGDNNLTNNSGGFDVTISVDQLGPPGP